MYFEIAGNGYFIKVHNGVGWREIFKNLFNARLPVVSARNEYLAINKLTKLNIDSLQLIGFGQRGLNPARLQSFVITKALSDHISLANVCQDWPDNPPSPRLKRNLIRKVAEITRRLHDNGINHRDLYLCHFLMKRQHHHASLPQLYLIDLHRVQIRANTPFRWKVKDLAAIHFSSMDIGLTQRDRLRFIREYTNHRPLRISLKQQAGFWQQINKKAHLLYKRHNNQPN